MQEFQVLTGKAHEIEKQLNELAQEQIDPAFVNPARRRIRIRSMSATKEQGYTEDLVVIVELV